MHDARVGNAAPRAAMRQVAQLAGSERMDIRLLTEADVVTFWALRLRALREEPEAFGSSYEEQRERPLEVARQRLRPADAEDGSFVLGAFASNGSLAGMVGVRREDGAKMRHTAEIWGMYVVPVARGRGVGHALLHGAIAGARLITGLERLVLAVVTTQPAAIALYRRNGFVRFGSEPRALKLPDGRYLDEDLMVLSLAP